MTAFSDAFRAEVARMARKEFKDELSALRKAVTAHRSEIAVLKRELKAQASQLKGLVKVVARQADTAKDASPNAGTTDAPARRRSSFQFRAEMLAEKREQLGISQQAMAVLLEALALSVARWESGKAMPRAAQVERIRAVLKMGKRAARAKLQN